MTATKRMMTAVWELAGSRSAAMGWCELGLRRAMMGTATIPTPASTTAAPLAVAMASGAKISPPARQAPRLATTAIESTKMIAPLRAP
jgi:hypothetical protein